VRRRARPGHPPQRPASPGWTTDGHRVKALLDYSRGPEKTWVYSALRVGDGRAVTLTAPSRNSAGYQRLLAAVETANPEGTIMVITDNLSSHSSYSTRTWLAAHPASSTPSSPRAPAGSTCRRAGGGCFAAKPLPGSRLPPRRRSPLATWVATCRLNLRACPWVWGRPPPSPRHRRQVFVYRL
jgi:hypothetical protein